MVSNIKLLIVELEMRSYMLAEHRRFNEVCEASVVE